tara:strand:+ start:988 stop:1821 length:834 start_codon:yes stop_codon:yes gene_type:complete
MSSNSALFFNMFTLDNLDSITGRNYYDSGSGFTQGTQIGYSQIRSLVNWALGDIYQTFDTSGSVLNSGDQYPEFVFKFKGYIYPSYLAFGNHNISSQSDGFKLYYSSDNITWQEVVLPPLTSDQDKIINTDLIASKKYWKIIFQNVQPDFKIGLFSFVKKIAIPHLSASLTTILDDVSQSSTKAAYSNNYHLSQYVQSFDNLNIKLNNLTRSYIDANAKDILKGIKDPFIFDYDTEGVNIYDKKAAYCLPVGKQQGLKINSNHLYSIQIKTQARSWS